MSYRFMRIFVFFDLPVETGEDKKEYRRFRKLLISNGFIMLQKSVYARMLITPSAEKALLEILRKNKPKSGIVQVLQVTEKQFSKMEYITGTTTNEVITGDERITVL